MRKNQHVDTPIDLNPKKLSRSRDRDTGGSQDHKAQLTAQEKPRVPDSIRKNPKAQSPRDEIKDSIPGVNLIGANFSKNDPKKGTKSGRLKYGGSGGMSRADRIMNRHF